MKGKQIGFALVIVGVAFVVATNTGARSSTLGLGAGVLLILAGVIRALRAS